MDSKNRFKDKKFVGIVATLCCLLWGSAYPAVKSGYLLFNISSGDIPSKMVFAGYRFTIAGAIVLLIAWKSGNKIFSLSKRNVLDVAALGIIQTTIQYIFFYIGLANTTGVKGSIMNSTGTFFSVILAHYIYSNDKLNIQKVSGCIIGFLGVMIVNFSPELIKFSFTPLGDGFIIMAALIFSIGAIYGKKLTKSMEVMVVTGYNLFIGGVILTFIGIFSGGRITNFTIPATMLLAYMAVLSSAAFSLWTLLLKYNKVGSVSIYNFLVPIFGAILSSIFLGESILEVKNIFALILVCMGIWLVNRERPEALQGDISK